MIPKKLYVRELDIDIFNEEAEATRSWVANRPNTGRREYTDLSQVWHPAEEVPQEDMDILCIIKNGEAHSISRIDHQLYDWLKNNNIQQWAYIKDLLPKGGEQ